MEEKFLQFVADVHAGKYNTKGEADQVEIEDPTNYAQCMDLAFAWCDYIGVPHSAISHFYAYQIWTQALDATVKYFEFIPNTPDGLPMCGNIIILGTGVGIAGHVCIKDNTPATNLTFTSLDQNWDTPHYHDTQGNPICRTVTHNYNNVLGWLRLKVPPPVLEITDQTKIPQIIDSNGNTMEVQAIRSELNDRNKTIVMLEMSVASLNSQITDLQNKIDSLPTPPETPSSDPSDSNQTPPVDTPPVSSGSTTTSPGGSVFSRAWKAFLRFLKFGK